MRSEDEDDEEDYDDENDEEEEERMVIQQSGVNGDVEMEQGSEEDSREDEQEEDDEDEDEDEDGEGDGEDDEDDEEDSDDEGDDDEDDAEGDEDEDDGDIEMGDVEPPKASPTKSVSSKPQPLPPYLARRLSFNPNLPTPLRAPSIEAIVAIPLPTPVHCLASTACSSYLLTGGADGHIRAYDFWSSVNGGQAMTSQQKSIVGLGEGVNKAGVARGWWSVEVESIGGGDRRKEGVYSLACEGDGLWALAGTQSGPINLYTLRHSPGHQVHSLKGHTNFVSCLSLLPGEKGVMSGSWDGSLREWDLNTGSVVRTYPTHGAQISSISLRPFTGPPTPAPSPKTNGHASLDGDKDDKHNIQVNVGPDFFQTRTPPAEPVTNGPTENATAPSPTKVNGPTEPVRSPSPFDPLFDDDADADGETVLPSTLDNTPKLENPTPPTQATSNPNSFSLALPPTSHQTPANSAPLFSTPATGPVRQAAANIPVLSPADWKGFSDDVLLASSMDGQVTLIDRRVSSNSGGVGRLLAGDKAPPWCMSACWSSNAHQILAGRRNGTIDIWDVRHSATSSTAPNLLRTLRTPAESGPISSVVALPDGKHVATASQDNLRLWNTAEYFGVGEMSNMGRRKSTPAFKIVAGHHGGIVSSMMVDPTGRFLVTASGDRGWQGESTRVVLIHEIKW